MWTVLLETEAGKLPERPEMGAKGGRTMLLRLVEGCTCRRASLVRTCVRVLSVFRIRHKKGGILRWGRERQHGGDVFAFVSLEVHFLQSGADLNHAYRSTDAADAVGEGGSTHDVCAFVCYL